MSGDADGSTRGMDFLVGDAVTAVVTAVILLLLGLCFIFSLCYGALNANVLGSFRHDSEQNDKKAKKILKILNSEIKYKRYAAAGFALNSFAAVILSVLTYSPKLSEMLRFLSDNHAVIAFVGAAAVFLVSFVLLLSFGKIIPERIGNDKAGPVMKGLSGAFLILCVTIFPLVGLSDILSDIILRILGYNTGKSKNLMTEEEILMMVDEGEESGVIEGNTKDMIENVFDFDDTCVGEIMTHRKDIVAVRDDAEISEVARQAIKSGKSRLPVYHDDIDNIEGIIYVKDLLKFVSTNAPEGVISKDIIKEAVFVPESKCCSEMFAYMTEHKTQIAVVVDEFGGTGGIITMEDLVESIVGNIQDEYDNEDEDIKRLDEHSFTVDGATPLDEITELTGIDFNEDDNDTLAGLMLDRMGHIPKNGEHPSIVINGTRFTVQEVDQRRISKVLIVKAKQKSDL